MVFRSLATNLVPGDTNGNTDTFVYDRENDSVERVSISRMAIREMVGVTSRQ